MITLSVSSCSGEGGDESGKSVDIKIHSEVGIYSIHPYMYTYISMCQY